MCTGFSWHPAKPSDWRLVIAGAKRFKAATRHHEAQISKVIESLGGQAIATGFIPIMRSANGDRAAISACPSLWNDLLWPF